MKMGRKVLALMLAMALVVAVYAQGDVEAKVVKKTGHYSAVLSKKGPGGKSYVKKAVIKKNKLIVYGRVDYDNETKFKTLKYKKRVFILSKDCSIWKNKVTKSGAIRGTMISVKKFNKITKKIKKKYNAKKFMTWDVYDGKVDSVYITP